MPRTQRPVVDSDGARRADLAKIHIAKKALGWDDDTYRDIMFTVCRVRSSSELDWSGRKLLLAHMEKCGAQVQAAPAKKRPALNPQGKRIWSLWQQLADAKAITWRDSAALNKWIKGQTQVDRFEWLNEHQAAAVIESLKSWLKRVKTAAA